MTRAFLIALAATAVFSFFFVPTFVLVSRGLAQQQETVSSEAANQFDQLDSPSPALSPSAPAAPISRTLATAGVSSSYSAANSTSSGPASQPASEMVTMGNKHFTAEIADTDASRQLGLSNRASLSADDIMLFVFPAASNWGFWMKDTLIPLDMIWLDSTGRVVYIQKDVLPSTYPSIFAPPNSLPALYVIEANAGTAASLGVKVGSIISLPIGLKAQ